MTEVSNTEPSSSPASRHVLLWLAEGEESHVKDSLEQAAEFLRVTPEAVAEAITSGEPLQGWFADWEVGAGNL